MKLKLPKTLKKVAKKGLVQYNPAVNVLYTTGAVLNRATGGKGALTVAGAMKGKKPVKYSTFTQAASGYQGKTPNSGDWALPVANRSTTKGIGMLAATIVKDVAHPVADAATEGLFGVKLKTLAWTAAGVAGAVLLGPPTVKAALR